jgi:hypothetical protein
MPTSTVPPMPILLLVLPLLVLLSLQCRLRSLQSVPLPQWRVSTTMLRRRLQSVAPVDKVLLLALTLVRMMMAMQTTICPTRSIMASIMRPPVSAPRPPPPPRVPRSASASLTRRTSPFSVPTSTVDRARVALRLAPSFAIITSPWIPTQTTSRASFRAKRSAACRCAKTRRRRASASDTCPSTLLSKPPTRPPLRSPPPTPPPPPPPQPPINNEQKTQKTDLGHVFISMCAVVNALECVVATRTTSSPRWRQCRSQQTRRAARRRSAPPV